MQCLTGYPVFPKDPILALIFGSLYLTFCIAIFFPSLTVTVRRLHDRNHSGFWVIAQLIPLLNLVVLLMLLLPSSPYPNYYGLRAPRFPGEKVPELGADIYGPYGTVAYRPQSNGDETVTQLNQNTPAKGSVMDEIMHENLANADAQAGIEDRPGRGLTVQERNSSSDERRRIVIGCPVEQTLRKIINQSI